MIGYKHPYHLKVTNPVRQSDVFGNRQLGLESIDRAMELTALSLRPQRRSKSNPTEKTNEIVS
jgi:hypothetical protein